MAAASGQPQETECAVCTNEFTTPKILPCGHLLCRECIVSWMETKPQAGCPLCRCPIAEGQGQGDQCAADIADSLPTDFVMEALVQSALALAKDPICCVCEDVKAEFICVQCLDLLCPSCRRIHQKMSATRAHDVESLENVTPERLAASRPALCAEHKDKQADAFCVDHGMAVCMSCRSTKHRGCTQLRDLTDEIKSTENSLSILSEILVQAEKILEQAIVILEERLQEIEIRKTEDMAQTDIACDRLQNLVEVFRNKLKDKTRESHSKVSSSIADMKSLLAKRSAKVTSHRHIVCRAKALTPRPAVIHVAQVLQDRVNRLDLTAHVEADVYTNPSPSSACCDHIVGRIERELQKAEEQKAKYKVSPIQASNVTLLCDPPQAVPMDTKTPEPDQEYGVIFFEDGLVVSSELLEPSVIYQMARSGETGATGATEEVPGWMYCRMSGMNPFVLDTFIKDFGISRWRRVRTSDDVTLLETANQIQFWLEEEESEEDELGMQSQDISRPSYAVCRLQPCVQRVTLFPMVKFADTCQVLVKDVKNQKAS